MALEVMLKRIQNVKPHNMETKTFKEQMKNSFIPAIEKMIEKDFLQSQDLMLISSKSWRNLIDSKSLWLSDIPSTLIISNP